MPSATAVHPNVTLFQKGYAAFNSGDLDTVRETFAPDILWHAQGKSRFAGDFKGVDETIASFLAILQATEGTFHLDVHDIVANDDHGVAIVTSHFDLGGTHYEDLGVHVVHIKDGVLTESWFFDWNPYQLDELFPA